MKLKSALADKGSWVRAELRVALGPGEESTRGSMTGVWRLPFGSALGRGTEADRGEVRRAGAVARGQGCRAEPSRLAIGRRAMGVRLSLPADASPGPAAHGLRPRSSRPTYWGCMLGQVTQLLQALSEATHAKHNDRYLLSVQ